MSVQEFYATGPGDRLTDTRLLPDRVQDFVDIAFREEYLLSRLAERGLEGSAVTFAGFGRLYVSLGLSAFLA